MQDLLDRILLDWAIWIRGGESRNALVRKYDFDAVQVKAIAYRDARSAVMLFKQS